MKKSGPVAVIGAGLSGLSCAQALHGAGIKVRVLERGNAVGGRCATQLWQGHLVDTGVQFFTAQSGDFKKELLTRLRQFRPLISPILDQDGTVVPTTYGPRFYVLQGNNYFAHVLSQGLDVRYGTLAEPVSFKNGKITCHGETYDAVVCAVPGPETARLLGLAQSPAVYDPSLIALLEYGGQEIPALGKIRECYGRIVTHDKGPLAASYCENNKVGRIVGQKTVFVAEATVDYSQEFADAPPDKYLPAIIKRHEELWGLPSERMTAAYGHCWKLGWPHPMATPNKPELPTGAFTCGDSRSESTVEKVWLDGQKAAIEVMRYLNS